ncbi:MAG: hypothetical protein KC620_18740, partial [Myxococcales bacterium]|nr:hypothetical protein [Myxococcales bacterium]
DERAVDPLMKVAADKELALEHKLAAVQQLAFLGSTKAIPDLMTLLTKEVNQYDPVSQGFRVQVALAIANLLDGSDEKTMAKFQKAIDDIKKGLDAWIADNNEKIGKVEKPELKQALAQDIKGYEEQKGNFGEVEAKLAVVRECKADVACLAGKLEAKEDAIRLLAAYRLAQTKGDAVPAARDALVKVAGTEDLVLRNVVFFGLDRLGDASIIPAMEKIRAADDARAEKDKRYKGAVYTTDLLIAKLKHKKG